MSGDEYALEQIAKIAKEAGISLVVFTDRDQMKWVYGLWPLRNIIKKSVEQNSIFKYGIKNYLTQIEELNHKFPGLIFVPGTESAPFYYWQGSALKSISAQREYAQYQGDIKQILREFRKTINARRKRAGFLLNKEYLKMYNWHRHILTVGLENPEDYRHLPVIGNPKGLRDGLNWVSIWPLLVLSLGLWYIRKCAYVYTDRKGRHVGFHPKARAFIAGIAVVISFILAWNNWPFLKLKFDQYHNDLGVMPYQNFIDYVNRKGGLTFWAHPEAGGSTATMDGAEFETPKHAELLLETKDYTGSSVIDENYEKIGKPGGIWDTVLKEYCQGLRKKPVWGIGGLAFESGNLAEAMRNLQVIVLVSEKSKKAVLAALRNGKIYVASGTNSLDFSLDAFYISDELDKVKGFVGDDLKIEGKSLLHIEGHFEGEPLEVEIRVIRQGEIVKTYKTQAPFKIIYYEEDLQKSKSYYRLEITGNGLFFITNPIFVN